MIIIFHNSTGLANIDKTIVDRSQAMKIVSKALKEGRAKLMVDTEQTLMYKIEKS